MDVFMSRSLPVCPTLPEDKDQGRVAWHCRNLEETSGLLNDTHPFQMLVFFFFYSFIYLFIYFIFGCIESSFLCVGFL